MLRAKYTWYISMPLLCLQIIYDKWSVDKWSNKVTLRNANTQHQHRHHQRHRRRSPFCLQSTQLCVCLHFFCWQTKSWFRRRDLGILTGTVYVTEIQIMISFSKDCFTFHLLLVLPLLLLLLLLFFYFVRASLLPYRMMPKMSSMNIPFGITCANQ